MTRFEGDDERPQHSQRQWEAIMVDWCACIGSAVGAVLSVVLSAAYLHGVSPTASVMMGCVVGGLLFSTTASACLALAALWKASGRSGHPTRLS
jgi:hypothetical protein